MTSKISFFKIAKEDLRRRVWMLALSCLGSFLSLPVAFLMINRDYLQRIARHGSDLSDAERIFDYYMDFFRTYAMITVGIVLVLGALITALWGFRYLYSRKMVDLYHSAPVKRGRLFFVVYLNGLLIWLIPLLAAVIITVILVFVNMASLGALPFFGSVLGMLLRMVGVAIVCFLTLYHFLLVCVMLSGNVFNALFCAAVLGVSVITFYGIVQLLCSAFFDTFVELPLSIDQILWASPLISPIVLMNDFVNTSSGALCVAISNSSYGAALFLRLMNAAMLLFHLWMAYILYKKRPSELSEHGVDHKQAQTLVRSCASILAGLFGGIIFLWMMDQGAIGWQIFGLLLCGIFAFGVSDIVLHMNFKSFFAHKLQMGGTILISCLIFFLFAFDLTGFDTRLPSRGSIKSSAINISYYTDFSYRYQFREDGVMHPAGDYYEPQVFEEVDTLYPLLEQLTDHAHREDNTFIGSMMIDLDTSTGPFRRTYHLLKSDLEALKPIVESEEYLQTFYPVSCGLFPLPQFMQAYSEISHTNCIITDNLKMQEIMDAYAADFKEHSSIETMQSGIIIATLDLEYPYARNYSNSVSTYSITLDIYSHFSRTLDKLKEYYPELILNKEKLDIVSLEIYSGLAPAELFLLPDKYAPAAPTAGQTTVVQEGAISVKQDVAIEYYGQITIKDKDEIRKLLPYLHPGNLAYGLFAKEEYVHIGHIVLSNGYSVSCNVKKTDLPLKAPASVITFLEENMTTP